MIGRRGRRSTHTPAGREKRRNGRKSTVPSAATWNAVACSESTATSGSAIWLMFDPNWLTLSAVQSFRKSACLQRPPRGQSAAGLRI